MTHDTMDGAGIHLMAKPAGPSCNLRCTYCFYLEKEALFFGRGRYRMSPEVLGAYVKTCVRANAHISSDILFAWQGGEPTLLGLDFFKKALALENVHAQGRPFYKSLQTNGILLDDRWCEFLARNRFLIGLSLDGPEPLHDRYRLDAGGQPTHSRVMRALGLLKKHGVEYNVLASVAAETARHPLDVYSFFKEKGIRFIQFLPIVERRGDALAKELGLQLGTPSSLSKPEWGNVTEWTVDPEQLGEFYVSVFEEWVRNDVGRVFIMNFEWTLLANMGGAAPVCHMGRTCGTSCVVEHNGDVYSCDHFVYPEFKLGNILRDDIRTLVESRSQRDWGAAKEQGLSAECRACDVIRLCRGGCPKHRFAPSGSAESGANFLCPAYKKFYRHSRKYMEGLRFLIENGLPCEYIMQAVDKPLAVKPADSDKPVILWVNES